VTASDQYAADLYIDRGTVTLIGKGLSLPADTVVDASGLLVMPGGVDVHTHLDLPVGDTASSDDFETGTVAAAHGGTTTIVDFATPGPGGPLRAALDAWHRKAGDRAVVDYGFHMVLTHFDDEIAAQAASLVRNDGVTSFKMFMAYPDRLMADDGAIFRALRWARDHGALVSVHAENGHVIDALVRDALRQGRTAPAWHAATRPVRTEAEATGRAIALADVADAPIYVVHVSCAEAADEIRRGRARGVRVSGETCPQYLCLSDAEYRRDGFEAAKFVMSPPLRPAAHQDALWRAVGDGTLQVVATDHCPFCMDEPPQKRAGEGDFSKIPNGAPGIETRLMLVWQGVREGRLTPQRFVDLVSTTPARIFGLWPRKGTIAVGSDGDLVLWDPEREASLSAADLHMRVDYSPYEGRVAHGAPAVVLSRGEVIVDHGTFTGRPGRGQYVPRHPSGA
jgi:dihydropyrimidinase